MLSRSALAHAPGVIQATAVSASQIDSLTVRAPGSPRPCSPSQSGSCARARRCGGSHRNVWITLTAGAGRWAERSRRCSARCAVPRSEAPESRALAFAPQPRTEVAADPEAARSSTRKTSIVCGQRLCQRQPPGDPGGLRPLGHLGAGHATLPRAAEHRAREAGAGGAAGRLQGLHRGPPGPPPGAALGGPRRRVPGAAPRALAPTTARGGGAGPQRRCLHPRGR